MMCPGISYSTVHSLMFHTNGSVQNNKLFKEFCNKKRAIFAFDGYPGSIGRSMIDNDTFTLLDQPDELKYDDTNSNMVREYEVMTTFIKINNISATWVNDWNTDQSIYQLAAGSYWCYEYIGWIYGWECCPPT